MKLVFWDPKIIVDMYSNTPYLIENAHECNCDYCHRGEEHDDRECSKCSYHNDDRHKFINKKGELQCPSCKSKLIEEDEYERILINKRQSYLPVNQPHETIQKTV